MGISVPSSPSQSLILQVARVVEISSNITLSGLQTIDGVTLVADERVLLTAQSDGTQNGLWKASAGAWSRPSDYESGVTVESNIVVPVSSGSTNADTRWQITTDGTIVVDTTSTTWAKTDLGITAVVDDTSPQLGGNLDLDSHNLVRGAETVLSTTTDGDAIHPNDVGIGAISDPARKLEILDASNPQIRLTQTDGTDYSEIGTAATANAFIGSPTIQGHGSGAHNAFFVRANKAVHYIQIQNSGTIEDVVSKGMSVGFHTNDAQIRSYKAGVMYIGTNSGIGITLSTTNDTTLSGTLAIDDEQASAPSAPASGDGGIIYVKNDGDLYYISDTVAETALTGGGGGGYTLETKTNSFSAALEYFYVITGAAPVTVTLPDAGAAGSSGKTIGFKCTNANTHTVTFSLDTGDKIDGVSTNLSITTNNHAFQLISDGSNWFIF